PPQAAGAVLGNRAWGALRVSMPDETPPRSAGSAILRGFLREAFEAARAGGVDAVEDHLELSGGQFQGGLVREGLGEVVTASLEALRPQAEAVSAPIKDLEAVGILVVEDEQVAGQGVGFEAVEDQSM